MFLSDFYQTCSSRLNSFVIEPEQASRFAKQVAGDFNPLHNPDSKRFCVPGDLLFAVSLSQLGLAKHMRVKFVGMLSDNRELTFVPEQTDNYLIQDSDAKTFLSLTHQDCLTRDSQIIAPFIKAYVAFSGESFPHLLVPIMAEHNIMINPARPMVMYESMAVNFDTQPTQNTQLAYAGYDIDLQGKRAQVALKFTIMNGDTPIGHGHKTMLLSGLRVYDAQAMQQVCDDYAQIKSSYAA
ncbi:DUF3581 family protein [Thiomicrospira sp. ALE5]|uniref:DUF3581 family protein n=1 Tax=Thiomicrospira sp. ALE5 TaxID=748650 RepID=UPI0008E20059|nr:DUF3581 family protein [Thiomicrospira sp. ALE5]SFR54680.1 Protein of unknown function [Thiomicrospira sp. ALE5]